MELEAGRSGAYSASWEYLFDELKRLDLLINLQVIKQRFIRQGNPFEQFKGLVLSQEEIDGLLKHTERIQTAEGLSGPDHITYCTLTESLIILELQIQKRLAASLSEGTYLTLKHLSRLFHLSPFEEQCILICLAPEMDRKYEKLYAYLQDDVTRKKPSVDLILNLLCNNTAEKLEARRAFSHDAPLFKYRLIQMEDSLKDSLTPLLARFLKLDDRIVNFILGYGIIDTRLEPAARIVYPEDRPEYNVVTNTPAEHISNKMINFVRTHFSEEKHNSENLVFFLYGYYGAGKHLLTEQVCYKTGFPLVVADTVQFLDNMLSFRENLWLLGREALLQQAALCFENFDVLVDDIDKYGAHIKFIFEVCSVFSRLTFMIGSRPWMPAGYLNNSIFISQELPLPDDQTRQTLWENFHREMNIDSSLHLGGLAGKFRFTPGQIKDAYGMAKNLAYWHSPDTGEISATLIHTACRGQSSQKLGKLASKINPKYSWKDIILPDIQIEQLKEVCSQVKNRHIVYGDWGFDRKLSLGKGLNVLFSGPPGTGKTMAAEVIANELDVDLYKIDLSQIVSKYIGETEKNLQSIFREAQFSNAILFFDEADALFGKRSDVKDAHDRYANIEIAYLLQKMEEYDGITILATNLRNNMDEAFARRLQFSVEFPFPNEEYREKIWQAMFPEEAPRSDDTDISFLAGKFNITGGNIKNIVLAAAFLAAEKAEKIGMKHLIRATRRELQKMGKICMKEDFGRYYEFLD